MAEIETTTFWQHLHMVLRWTFSEVKWSRDMFIGGCVSAAGLLLQVSWALISREDWHLHKLQWIGSVILPTIAVIALNIALRFFLAPWKIHQEQEHTHFLETKAANDQAVWLKSEIHRLEAPKEPSGPIVRLSAVEFSGGVAGIEVSNIGNGAYFYAPIQMSGSIDPGNGAEAFAKWAHSDEVRSWIAQGQTCRLILARLVSNAGFSRWHVPVVDGKVGVLGRSAIYSSCFVSIPIVRAPDINITGTVFAEPDLLNGPKRFAATLRAFDAVDAQVPQASTDVGENRNGSG